MKRLLAIIFAVFALFGTLEAKVESYVTNVKSGLTVQEIDKKLENTPMRNMGKFILECENKYGVNAAFIVAVACVETGYGKAGLGASSNAIFSIKDWKKPGYCRYKTKQEAIDHFCRVISSGKNYHTKKKFKVEQIGKTYCPVRTKHWVSNVYKVMRSF